MDKAEITELSEMESPDNCCIFCQSKCTECGSVNIEVQYLRVYDLSDDHMVFSQSDAQVCCQDCGVVAEEEEIEIPGSITVFQEIIKERKLIPNSAIAKHIDQYFYKKQKLHFKSEIKTKLNDNMIKTFVIFYQYTNNERNSLSIEKYDQFCINVENDRIYGEIANYFSSMFKDVILLECKEEQNDSGAHYVIECKEISIIHD